MKILVIDDDFATRKILSIMLRDHGDIVTAEDAPSALSLIGKSLRDDEFFELICIDIAMPGMDGLELLHAIRKIEDAAGFPAGSGTKIIITSANAESGMIMEAFKEHCDAYLVKPVKKGELEQALSSLGLTKQD